MAGVIFRFYNVDHKVFWDDEIYSALHVGGYTEAALVSRAQTFRTSGQLRALLHSQSQDPSGPLATVTSLAREDPSMHPSFTCLSASGRRPSDRP
jgi:uncharacterized membrane protein